MISYITLAEKPFWSYHTLPQHALLWACGSLFRLGATYWRNNCQEILCVLLWSCLFLTIFNCLFGTRKKKCRYRCHFFKDKWIFGNKILPFWKHQSWRRIDLMLQCLKGQRFAHDHQRWPSAIEPSHLQDWSPSSTVHMWVVTTALNCQLVQADAGSHQVPTGRRSSHPPLLDPTLTVAGGHSWCLAIIISQSVDLGGAKLPRPSQMDSMNAHKAKLRCQGGV